MIIPALLTDQRNDLIAMLALCQKFAEIVQIDVMDGEFVPSKSIGINDLAGIQTNLKSEAHLMVQDPLAWLDMFKKIGTEKIIFHAEIKQDISAIIKQIRQQGFSVGMAINPPTKLTDCTEFFNQVDSVLFMSVNPGFYGAAFIPEVLDKIKAFKKQYPKVHTSIDGGIKLANIVSVKASGVDTICVGSAVLKALDPVAAYQQLTKVVYG